MKRTTKRGILMGVAIGAASVAFPAGAGDVSYENLSTLGAGGTAAPLSDVASCDCPCHGAARLDVIGERGAPPAARARGNAETATPARGWNRR